MQIQMASRDQKEFASHLRALPVVAALPLLPPPLHLHPLPLLILRITSGQYVASGHYSL